MHTRSTKRSGNRGRNRGFNNSGKMGRRACFEALESRQLLSITLPTIANVTLPAGTTMFIPLGGSDPGQTVNYCRDGFGLFQAHAGHDAADQQDPSTERQHQRHDEDDGLPVVRQSRAGHHRRDRGAGQVGVLQRPADLPQRTGRQRQSLRHPRRQRSAHRRHQDRSIVDGRGVQSRISSTPSAGLLAMARTSTPSTSSTEFFVTGGSYPVSRFQLHDLRRSDQRVDVVNTIAAMPDENSTQDPNGSGISKRP